MVPSMDNRPETTITVRMTIDAPLETLDVVLRRNVLRNLIHDALPRIPWMETTSMISES